MYATMNAAAKKLVRKVEALIIEKLPKKKADNLIEFIHQYFANVPSEELVQREVNDLYGAVMSHWSFMANRKPDEIKLRVYNPTTEKDGWQLSHSVVEVSQNDIPFLVDTLTMALGAMDINMHLIIHAGGVRIVRDKDGLVTEVLTPDSPPQEGEVAEAPIYIEIDRQEDDELNFENIRKTLNDVLIDNNRVVSDFPAMKGKLREMVGCISHFPKSFNMDPDDVAEAAALVNWVDHDHFTLTGYGEYILNTASEHGSSFDLKPKTALGLLREKSRYSVGSFLRGGYSALETIEAPKPVIITKSNYRSTVHRPAQMIVIRVPIFKDDKVVGEHCMFGLYTSAAYHSNPRHIPILRRKVERIINMSGLSPKGHAGKALQNILVNFPRDELFQIEIDTLFKIVIGVLQIQERQQVRLFIRKDTYNRYYCCMIYIPREVYNSDLLVKIQNILMQELDGVDATCKPNFLESVLCRIDFFIRVDVDSNLPKVDIEKLEAKLVVAARDWRDDFKAALVETYGEHKGSVLYHKYSRAFPAGYREAFLARSAAVDVEHIESVYAGDSMLGMCFYRMLEEADDCIRFKLFQRDKPIPLTFVLPILENMGLRVIEERPYEVHLPSGASVWISDFGMQVADSLVTLDDVSDSFQTAFAKVWTDEAENDGFNKLIMKAGLGWREVLLLRAYAKYMIQTKLGFSQQYIEETLQSYPLIVAQLIQYFKTKFDPTSDQKMDQRLRELTKIKKDAEQLLDSVKVLDQDKIFRRYFEIMNATVRTNFYQTKDDTFKSYVSLKINSSQVSDLPQPVPLFEIFVHSPRVDGIHLRGARVARGGLRWSDRREDYRTEVLGLMKAQQVKNAVIVPLGAKGGFVPLKLPLDQGREAIMKEAISCYKTFISALLDVTDNRDGMKVIPPQEVVRYDQDDSYLVVAADKGTATFSDIANEVAGNYNFWLGDAFASGGSNGYDHKKMGITARGAWESVKRHFLTIGVDCQKQDFTAIGIGDMSGDVFGNGMLLSEHIRLVAAFNHMHIFIDPDPVANTSFDERQRLFDLPRSTWADYSPSLISKGGGVFDRNAKVIDITPEIQKFLKLKVKRLTPDELIKAILIAKVDLFWNGGIGTYVKATKETHLDVGDRSNDLIRVDATELKCKVIGEGGNLGLTQLGRIEFAMAGGLVYTDFIDNSAGVDCSDHEVNIKIALDAAISRKDLKESDRNSFLAEMADDVAGLVLENNYQHNRILYNALDLSDENVNMQIRLLRELEREKFLDRKIEFLPTDKELKARHAVGQCLSGPECAVLMAYSKTAIKSTLLTSKLPDEPYFFEYFQSSFPVKLCEKFGEGIKDHPLYREITATQLINMMFRYMGMSFVHRLYDETGGTPSMIASAFVVTKEVFEMPEVWDRIEALDGEVPVSVQRDMMRDVEKLVRRSTRWLLRNRRSGFDIQTLIADIKPKVQKLRQLMPKYLSKEERKQIKDYVTSRHARGVPKDLALDVAEFMFLSPVLDIIDAANKHNTALDELAEIFLKINHKMNFSWFRSELKSMNSEGYWGMLASSALRDDLDKLERMLALCVHRDTDPKLSVDERIDAWRNSFRYMVNRWEIMMNDLKLGKREFVVYVIAIRGLLDLAQSATYLPQEE